MKRTTNLIVLPPEKREDAIRDELTPKLMVAHAGKPVRVKWEIARPDRTPAQNRYLWAVPYELLHEATGYEKEELHEWFCGARWGWVDKPCPKTPSNPRGIKSVPVRSTTTDENGEHDICSAEDFVKIWEHAQRVGSKLGVVIQDPDPDWWKK